MLLIDSLYINNSGGLTLLKYLVKEIQKFNTDIFYLIDHRCSSHFLDIPDNKKCIMKASLLSRYNWYRKYGRNYKKIFCFGNIPPPIKLKCTVYTYFHNINLLNIPLTEPIKIKIISATKRFIFCRFKKNTDYWIVQTSNTKNELIKHLWENPQKVKILPFYNIEGADKCGKLDRDGFIYASNYTRQKNFEFVIKCWDMMAEHGYTPTLHLTLNYIPPQLLQLINCANKKGAKIINHGHLDTNELFSLYRKTKALVYAATNESLGLCIIEAIENGCDVIAPDLPYVYCICNPSSVFTLFSIKSFVKALQKYESEPSTTENLSTNKINELLNLLI